MKKRFNLNSKICPVALLIELMPGTICKESIIKENPVCFARQIAIFYYLIENTLQKINREETYITSVNNYCHFPTYLIDISCIAPLFSIPPPTQKKKS